MLAQADLQHGQVHLFMCRPRGCTGLFCGCWLRFLCKVNSTSYFSGLFWEKKKTTLFTFNLFKIIKKLDLQGVKCFAFEQNDVVKIRFYFVAVLNGNPVQLM